MTPAHEYCVEFYERTIENLKGYHEQDHIELTVIERICAKDEFMALALTLDDAKITGIIETMKVSKNPLSKTNSNPRSYKKITRLQTQAVAKALIGRYTNAMGVINEAFNGAI